MRSLNRRGQAFIPVMMGLALVGLIGAGSVTMIRSSQDELAALSRKQGHLKLQDDLMITLQRSAICRAVFHASGFNVAAGSIPVSIDLPLTNTVAGASSSVAAGANLPDYDVHVNGLGITFDSAHPDLNPVLKGNLAAGGQLWFVNLRLAAQSYPTGTPYKYVDIGPFYVETSGGAVQNCYGETDIAAVSNSTCQVLGGSYTPGHCAILPKFAEVSCDSGSLSSFTLATAAHNCMAVDQ